MPLLPTWISLALCVLQADRAAAVPTEDGERLVGYWEGALTTTMLGEAQSGSVDIRFMPGGAFVSHMPERETGRYSLQSNGSILLEFGATPTPTDYLLLRAVALDTRQLTATVEMPGQPPALQVSTVLSMAKAAPRSDDAGPSRESGPVAKRLIASAIAVPVGPPASLSWHHRQVVAAALERGLADAFHDVSAYELKSRAEFEVDGDSDVFDVRAIVAGFVSDSIDMAQTPFAAAVREAVAPCFADPRSVRIQFLNRLRGQQAFGVLAIPDLRPEFVEDGRVRFAEAWAKVVNAIEAIPDVSLDVDTLKELGSAVAGSKSISSAWRLLPATVKGLIEVERVHVSMKTTSTEGSKDYGVEISAKYELQRRRASSRKWVSVPITRRVQLAHSDASGSVAELAPDDYVLRAVFAALAQPPNK